MSEWVSESGEAEEEEEVEEEVEEEGEVACFLMANARRCGVSANQRWQTLARPRSG